MGQSMAQPQSQLNSQRGSRSLRHSARLTASSPSVFSQRRSSLTPNKSTSTRIDLPPKPSKILPPEQYSQPSLKSEEKRSEFLLFLKERGSQRESQGKVGERSLLSPNFGEAIQETDEYCFKEEWSGKTKGPVSKLQPQHHEITISFSKSKNHSTNPFHPSQEEDTKGIVENILQNTENSKETHIHRAAYFACEQKSASLAGQKQASCDISNQNKSTKQNRCQVERPSADRMFTSTGDSYNDYENSLPEKVRKYKLSKKMQQIKLKLQNRFNDSKQLSSATRRSIHDISQSRSFTGKLKGGSKSLRNKVLKEKAHQTKQESAITFKQKLKGTKATGPKETMKEHHKSKKSECSESILTNNIFSERKLSACDPRMLVTSQSPIDRFSQVQHRFQGSVVKADLNPKESQKRKCGKNNDRAKKYEGSRAVRSSHRENKLIIF